MTDPTLLKPDLGRFGVWTAGAPHLEQAGEIERLGYGAVWVGGSPPAGLDFVEPILAATENLSVATGIVNIWSAPADEVAASYHRIEAAYPGRFLLGVGVGHPEHTQEYQKPFSALVDYLDALDAQQVPTSRRVIAALGPKVLQLAAERSAGAHPYLTTRNTPPRPAIWWAARCSWLPSTRWCCPPTPKPPAHSAATASASIWT